MKKLVGLLLTLMLMLGTAGPALADCCDSLFGCAAAYVTDGLSCVLQEIVSTIKNLVTLLTNLSARASGTTQKASDTARQYVSDTIAKTRSDGQQASSDLANALQQANTIYKEETSLITAQNSQTKQMSSGLGGTTPTSSAPTRPGVAQAGKQTGPMTAQPNVHSTVTVTPAAPQNSSSNTAQKINGTVPVGAVPVQQTLPPHGALEGLFEKAIAQIQKLKAAGDQDYPKVSRLMTQAEQSEGPALQSALVAADKAINDPIRNMISKLTNMLTDPTSLFDPTDIVTQLENNVLANLDTNINQMVDTITAGPQRAFDAAQPMQDELVGGGQRAKQIASAMQMAYSSRTQTSLNALSELLPLTAVGTSNNAVATSLVPTGALQLYSQIISKFKNDKQKIAPQAKQSMQALTPLLNQLKSLHTQAVAAHSSVLTYKNNFMQKLNTMFSNKTQAEINAQRDQLISQAQAQYASDPKTRDKIVALLASETAKVRAVPKQ
jgi:hypothetical protein